MSESDSSLNASAAIAAICYGMPLVVAIHKLWTFGRPFDTFPHVFYLAISVFSTLRIVTTIVLAIQPVGLLGNFQEFDMFTIMSYTCALVFFTVESLAMAYTLVAISKGAAKKQRVTKRLLKWVVSLNFVFYW
jgi:hypothetical protein